MVTPTVAETKRETRKRSGSLTMLLPQILRAGAGGNELVLLDVRENEEWEAGHAAGLIDCPYSGLSSATAAGLPRRRPLAVGCARGKRSSLAACLLTRAGVLEVLDVSGGGIVDLPAYGVALVPDKRIPRSSGQVPISVQGHMNNDAPGRDW